jgi:hypothetical protein
MSIRREKVVLDLEDNLSRGMLTAAAATKALDRALTNLDGRTRLLRTHVGQLNDNRTGLPAFQRNARDTDIFLRSMAGGRGGGGGLWSLSEAATASSLAIAALNDDDDGVGALGRNSRKTGDDIVHVTGQLRTFLDVMALLGPSVVPIAGSVLPWIGALTNDLGFAALATGGVAIAFTGMGDALKAVNKAALEPTEDNLMAARIAMEKLGPAAQSMVQELRSMIPMWEEFRAVGAAGLFPGMERGFENLKGLLPTFENILFKLTDTAGDLFARGTASLGTERWAAVFRFLQTEARPSMVQMAETVGDLTHGLAAMWMALEPMNQLGADWMSSAANSFDQWAIGLQDSEGLQEFVAYLDEVGPQVADTLGSIANAILQIAEAVAPIGGPILEIFEMLADTVAMIANTDAGSVFLIMAAGMSVLTRATLGYTKAMQSAMVMTTQGFGRDMMTMWGNYSLVAWSKGTKGAQEYEKAVGRVKGVMGGLGRSAALIGGIALATSEWGDSAGFANTASMALMGSIGGLPGAILGGALGAVLDMAAADDKLVEATERVDQAMSSMVGPEEAASALANLDSQIAATEATMDRLSEAMNPEKQGGTSGVENWLDFKGAIRNSYDMFVGLKSNVSELFTGNLEEAKAARDAAMSGAIDPMSMEVAAKPIQGVTDAIRDQTDAIWANINAMRVMKDEALEHASAETEFYGALLDAKTALKENKHTLDVNTEAGLKNRKILENMVATWNKMSVAEQVAYGGAKKMRQSLYDTARAFGASKVDALEYVNMLYSIPTERNTAIKVEADAAKAAIRGVKQLLDTLHDRTIHIFAGFTGPAAGAASGGGGGGPSGGGGGGPSGPGTDPSTSDPRGGRATTTSSGRPATPDWAAWERAFVTPVADGYSVAAAAAASSDGVVTQLFEVTRRLASLERTMQAVPEATGDAVGTRINSAAASAVRRKR